MTDTSMRSSEEWSPYPHPYLHVDHVVNDDELHKHLNEIEGELENCFCEEIGGSTICGVK